MRDTYYYTPSSSDVVSRLDMSHKSTEYQPESRYTTNIYASCKAHRVDLFKFVRLTFSFFLIFCVCVCDSRDSVSPRRRTVIQSRLGAIKLTRYVYPIDIIYPRQQHTHKKKRTDSSRKQLKSGSLFYFPVYRFVSTGPSQLNLHLK